MLIKRAIELLKMRTLGCSIPTNFTPNYAPSTFETTENGMTRTEYAYLCRVWDKMPAYACFTDAVLKVALSKNGRPYGVKCYE